MKKDNIYWLWCLTAYIALGLFGFMLCPSLVHMRLYFSCSIISAAVDAVAFFVCCVILRKFGEFTFWKLGVYLVLIIAPSIIIASITTDLSHPMYYSLARHFVLWSNVSLNLHSFLFFCALIVLMALNFVLWRALFNVTIRQAMWVSIPLGFINTIICWLTTPIFK
jgi:hypothetical protein